VTDEDLMTLTYFDIESALVHIASSSSFPQRTPLGVPSEEIFAPTVAALPPAAPAAAAGDDGVPDYDDLAARYAALRTRVHDNRQRYRLEDDPSVWACPGCTLDN